MKRQITSIAIATLLIVAIFLAPVSNTARAAAPTELFFSEYIEGSSYNKALEIYNGTGATIDLAAGGYTIQMYFNGSATSGLDIPLTGSVANEDVFVVTNQSAAQVIKDQADLITTTINWFNGDDAVVLSKGGLVLDVIGQVGFDPGTQWGVDLVSTADNTLRRIDTICTGDPDGSNAFNPSAEWIGFANDTFDDLGLYIANCGTSILEPKLNEFSASTTGTDVEYVEVFGTAGADYSAYTILEIEVMARALA